jgi:hypothetical protein
MLGIIVALIVSWILLYLFERESDFIARFFTGYQKAKAIFTWIFDYCLTMRRSSSDRNVVAIFKMAPE